MKYFFSMIVLISSLTAFAKTELQCDEPTSNQYNKHERFMISLDGAKRIEKMHDYVWNDATNTIAGSGTANYDSADQSAPLAYEAEDGTLVYQYQFQNEGDVDYPAPLTDVTIILLKDLVGAATVSVVYDDGSQGADTFKTNCVIVTK